MEGVIKLRVLEPRDALTLFLWDNDSELREAQEAATPPTLLELQSFCKEGPRALEMHGQQRWMIDLNEESIGTLELFDFHSNHQRAGIGIVLARKEFRNRGLGTKVLLEAEKLAKEFSIQQLWAIISEDNLASLRAFEKAGYQRAGHLKKWFNIRNQFFDGILVQKFIP